MKISIKTTTDFRLTATSAVQTATKMPGKALEEREESGIKSAAFGSD